MAKDHGPSVKDDKQYEGLRKKGMSKERGPGSLFVAIVAPSAVSWSASHGTI